MDMGLNSKGVHIIFECNNSIIYTMYNNYFSFCNVENLFLNKVQILKNEKVLHQQSKKKFFRYKFTFRCKDKTILCGCDKGKFCLSDMKTEEYAITSRNHNQSIYDLLLIDYNTFLSCSSDNTIKVWK